MKPLIPVLFTGKVGDHPLRLFRSPLQGPDLPWHSVDDLHVCLRFPREVRRTLKANLQKGWAANVRSIATASGLSVIAPHPMAQGLISAAEDAGAPHTAAEDYARSGAKALSLITAEMPPADLVAYSVAAYHRGGGL